FPVHARFPATCTASTARSHHRLVCRRGAAVVPPPARGNARPTAAHPRSARAAPAHAPAQRQDESRGLRETARRSPPVVVDGWLSPQRERRQPVLRSSRPARTFVPATRAAVWPAAAVRSPSLRPRGVFPGGPVRTARRAAH